MRRSCVLDSVSRFKVPGSMFRTAVGARICFMFRAARESIKLNDVLDPSGATEKKITICVHWETPGDQRFHCVRPTLGERPEISNRIFEGLASGVDRAENDLVF